VVVDGKSPIITAALVQGGARIGIMTPSPAIGAGTVGRGCR